ncbi:MULTISPECIES: hypothetical protein [unclassified Methanoregula]|uniref:hypothetical protein n=1 Tax=unclassified Methanoregula TaxID=2649730 RepID=UPI0009D10831|nr:MULTISPECIES: hypothetical protein [unclassified Methanoregula]OPX65337.1 MAG: hypothetical protein A4E33_00370 [Methanoregula sp. PtaB.Bin085]OPY32246.1 MAG: hypothetical protein A4E34_02620 [Methanoregula sp. PtaU1.Bin006]
MAGNSGLGRIPSESWYPVLVTIAIIMLCCAAGCMSSFGTEKKAEAGSGGGSGGGSSGGDNAGSAGSGDGGSGSGSWSSPGSDEPETSTWQATVSATEKVWTKLTYVRKLEKDTSRSEETTSTLQFQGSFPVQVDHEQDYQGKDIYRMHFTEGKRSFPVSGSFSEQSTSLATGGEAGCHPMDSYTFDYEKQGTISQTDFDFGFYPDGKMIQLDGGYTETTHSKSVSSDGKCDGEDTDTQDGVFWFQCHSEADDAKGTEFDGGQRDFKMDGTSYVITCHVKNVREMKDDESLHYTSPSSTTREITMRVVLDPVPPKPKKLKAVPGGPYTVERGTPLQLDGSKSTGSITEYTWTFTKGAGCPSSVSIGSGTLTGSQQTVTFLCPVTAKLTVTDGKSTDSATVPVSVTPRSWETPFTLSAEGFDTGFMATPPWYNSLSGMYEGGASICGLCEGTADESSNLLHPAPKGGSWETAGGYRIATVSEPGKPFDGYSYTADYKVEMNRKTVINPNILPAASGGKELPYGMGSFYQHNLDAKYNVDGYLAGIRKHEKDHADRMKQALRSADPAKDIEKIIEKDKDTVKKNADKKLHDTEKLICQKSSDASQPPMAVTWTGKLLFPTADTNEWKEGTTSVGGYRADAGASCG